MNLSMDQGNVYDEELPIRLLLRAIGSSYVDGVYENHQPHHSNAAPYIHHHHHNHDLLNNNSSLNHHHHHHQSSRLGLGVVGPEQLAFSMERLSLSSSSSSSNHYDDGLRRSAAGIRLGSQPQQIYLPPQHFIEREEGRKQRLIEMILSKVKDRLHEIMMDKSFIHLIETFFEASTVSQKTLILDLLVRDQHKLANVCNHGHGTKLFQRFLSLLTTPMQKSTAVFALKEITLKLAKNIYGGYVIQHCLKHFAPELSQIILEEVGKNCVEIARDMIGCSTYQRCLDQAKGDAFKKLIEKVVSNVLLLVEDRYGNYVVLYIIKMNIPLVNARIISQLIGKLSELCMHKHGSTVVEGLLEFSEEGEAAVIVQELVLSHNFVTILKNRYGNCVAQRALENSKGPANKMLSNSILRNYPYLNGHFYGKRLLAFLKKGCNKSHV